MAREVFDSLWAYHMGPPTSGPNRWVLSPYWVVFPKLEGGSRSLVAGMCNSHHKLVGLAILAKPTTQALVLVVVLIFKTFLPMVSLTSH